MLHARNTIAALCLVAGGMLCVSSARAGEGDDYITGMPAAKFDGVETNVVNDLQSNIPGIQADAAQLVRDLKGLRPDDSFSDCVIPLMAILKNEDGESSARILAALALDRLDSDMGNFAIERTATFTSDPMLKHLCTWLAYDRITGKHPGDTGIASFEPLEEGAE
ncbi:MAG TPA: hypothetical protein VL221_00290 [Bacteroidota bacterium]|nr:hypothetical protein [Bacteroidota bacterium]